MNPEQFSDALNYLDDDLIAQTDELRQGRRVLHRPKVIRWLAPAACLALVLGMAAWLEPFGKTMQDAATSNNGMAGLYQPENAPGEMQADHHTADAEKSSYSTTAQWQSVSAGEISLEIPGDWTYRVESGEDSLYIVIRPDEVLGELWIGRDPNFGVCGTGLTEKETTVGGMQALAGYYDGGTNWSFISIRVGQMKYVIRKDGAESWWNANENTVDQILDTIVIGD